MLNQRSRQSVREITQSGSSGLKEYIDFALRSYNIIRLRLHILVDAAEADRVGRYDSIYRATVKMCPPVEIWRYPFHCTSSVFPLPSP